MALYGLSHVKDERLHRLFRENKVEFELPLAEEGRWDFAFYGTLATFLPLFLVATFYGREWFHILVLHQNRAKRGPTSFIPESFIPDFFHLVIWGHEHDCRLLVQFTGLSAWCLFLHVLVLTGLCQRPLIRIFSSHSLDLPVPPHSVRARQFRKLLVFLISGWL